MVEKRSHRQIWRLTAIENRASDVGGEIGHADDPGTAGSVQLFAPGELGKFAAGTAGKVSLRAIRIVISLPLRRSCAATERV